MTHKILSVDWCVPIVTPPIQNALVVIQEDRVAWLGKAENLPNIYKDSPIDTIGGIMTPGLVNAHTHLQFSHMHTIGKGTYDGLKDWFAEFNKGVTHMINHGDWHQSAIDGIKMAQKTGTTVFSEIITHDVARGALCKCHATGIEYIETFGDTDETWQAGGKNTYINRLDSQPHKTNTVDTGVSPHTPYSLDGGVIKDMVSIANDRDMRVHTHVGESALENDYYQFGEVHPMPTCILDIQFTLLKNKGCGMDTVAYADSLGLLNNNTHIAHGVYFDKAQRDVLLERKTQVALCPRSNKVIGLDAPPVAQYLTEGHDVCVGTDSLASCPSMDIMADVKYLAHIAKRQGYNAPDLYTKLMTAVTVAGARALGLAQKGYGTITPNAPAHIAIFDIKVPDDNVEKALVDNGEGNCIYTLSNGKVVHDCRL